MVEPQEKKAKGGLVSGFLSKKHLKVEDVSKDDPMVTAHSPTKRPASPISSLEVIAFAGEETKKKKKIGGKPFLPSFWDDVDAAALKAYEVLSVDDLNPSMAKSSNEVMSSHTQKLVQVCVDSVDFIFLFVLLFAKRDFMCRLWGNLCSFLGSFWTWRRRCPQLSQ